ncbi:hypothetical protein F4604DRAFT_1934968 [Suillus subluteus]|nr:hypothetical protein F4604DRAFT_1934968 [Suillus subluteus]
MSRINHTACMGSLPMKGRKVLTQLDVWFDSRPAQSVAAPRRQTMIKARLRHAANKAKSMLRIPTAIEQQMLLECSVPIWPTQLRRYTETPSLVTQHCDYSVQMMQIDLARCELRGDWEECTHPSGATYHYNAKMNAFTEMNMRSCSDEELQRLERWIHASRLKINDNQWLLVVEPILVRGEEVYTYYCVVPKNRTITWLQTVDTYLLFQECATASHWNHKRLELEAQFWKHVEYFPSRIDISLLEVRMLRYQFNWYRVGEFFEALALENSTAASIFWTLDQMKEMANELAIAEELAVHDGIVKESGVAICGAYTIEEREI